MRRPKSLPEKLRSFFWEMDFDDLEIEAHANYIIPRILELGTMAAVRWLIATYGLERIHAFLRDVGQPELSDRTLHFWRALLNAENEQWPTKQEFRSRKFGHWPP